MKKIFIIVAMICLLLASCVKVTPNPVPEDTFREDLSGFLATKSTEPLEGTLWVSHTGEQYDRYLLFNEGEVNLFYGLVEEGELQRWSDYYTASYELAEDGRAALTKLSYPVWGEKAYDYYIAVIQSVDSFTIKTVHETFEYFGNFKEYEEDLEGQWIIIYVGIVPWAEDN